jgi:hypothetical protein
MIWWSHSDEGKTITMRIDQLQPGTEVTLRFHGSLGNVTQDEPAVFGGITGEGDERRAHFTSVEKNADDVAETYEWEAYRYSGRWAYGTSADRLQLVEVKG